MKVRGRILHITFSLTLALVALIVMSFSKRPLPVELMIAGYVITGLYFIFTFICLYFDIGIKNESLISFAQVPGFTKYNNLTKRLLEKDIKIDLALISMGFVPSCIVISIFLISGLAELFVFLALIIVYFSFYRILRVQLGIRFKTRGRIGKSLIYALFYSLIGFGIIPLALNTYIIAKN